MILPGHLAGGYLVTKALALVVNPAMSPEQMVAIFIIGTLAGELPDIDIAIHIFTKYFTKRIDKPNHREYITHTPLFWAIISGIISSIGYLINSDFVIFGGLIILAGTWSHLLLDSIEYGVRWLWPFSNKRYSIIKESTEKVVFNNPGSISYYFDVLKFSCGHKLLLYIEICITLLALYFVILTCVLKSLW